MFALYQYGTGLFYEEIRCRLSFTKSQLIEKLRRLKNSTPVAGESTSMPTPTRRDRGGRRVRRRTSMARRGRGDLVLRSRSLGKPHAQEDMQTRAWMDLSAWKDRVFQVPKDWE